MVKEDRYSLGYAIGNSIQMNKDKITKLEKKVKSLTDKNKKLQHQLEEKDKIIEEKNKCLLEIAKEEMKMVNWLKSKGMNFDNESWVNELDEILERGKNENNK